MRNFHFVIVLALESWVLFNDFKHVMDMFIPLLFKYNATPTVWTVFNWLVEKLSCCGLFLDPKQILCSFIVVSKNRNEFSKKKYRFELKRKNYAAEKVSPNTMDLLSYLQSEIY